MPRTLLAAWPRRSRPGISDALQLSGRVAVVEHDHRRASGPQHAVHLAHRTGQVAGVMQAADRVDEVEGVVGLRQSERRALDHPVARRPRPAGATGGAPSRPALRAMSTPWSLAPRLINCAAERAVSQPDLEHRRVVQRLLRQVRLQVRIQLEVRGVEAGQTLGRGVGHAELARQRGAAELVPELGVARVQRRLSSAALRPVVFPLGAHVAFGWRTIAALRWTSRWACGGGRRLRSRRDDRRASAAAVAVVGQSAQELAVVIVEPSRSASAVAQLSSIDWISRLDR